MMLEPAGSFAVLYLAAPVLSASFASIVEPSSNSMSPVGVTAADETVTVKLTAWPVCVELADETTVIVVVALFTTCGSGVAVLPIKLLSPL